MIDVLVAVVVLAAYGWVLRSAWRNPDRDIALIYGGATVALALHGEWTGVVAWGLIGAVHGGRRWWLYTVTYLDNGIKVTHRRGTTVR